MRNEAHEFIKVPESAFGDCTLSMMWIRAAKRMSAYGGMIRNRKDLKIALDTTNEELTNYLKLIEKPTVNQLPLFYRLRDMLISQKMYLSAMLDYMQSGAGSRGSALYTDDRGRKSDYRLPDLYKCRLDRGAHAGIIQEVTWKMVYVSQNGVRCAHSLRLITSLRTSGNYIVKENQFRT